MDPEPWSRDDDDMEMHYRTQQQKSVKPTQAVSELRTPQYRKNRVKIREWTMCYEW